MSNPFHATTVANCPGPDGADRRSFLRMGLAGFTSLSLPGILRLRAENPGASADDKTAVIMVWKPGGCSHIDTYDPKPLAESEYRGPFRSIGTKIPGVRFSELIPRQAAIADKFTLLRSMHQTAGGHPAGSMQMFSGDSDTRDKPKPRLPDWMSVANYVRSQAGPRSNPLPRYVGISPPTAYNGPAYLGDAYAPFSVTGDPNSPSFSVPNIGLSDPHEVKRLDRRIALRKNLDTLQRAFDRYGELDALDQFEAQALTLLTNPQTKEAFDLSKEDDRTRYRYGRNTWGQQLLLARRLVEAGVEVLTSSLRGPMCGRVNNWDDHAVNHHVFDAMRFRAGAYDQAVSALIEDIYDRGLDKRVLVVVTGEFGRTPKINDRGGRDHWSNAMSVMFAGGGTPGGQVVGATDRHGYAAVERILSPENFVSTVYSKLGIDPGKLLYTPQGRPTHLVSDATPIRELMG
jgi:uncharacterized protein (DUF1501 family)